ncbi:MAG: MATE family efflux transporter, partial [Phocaeicola sp.]|nr:MATE family efflux transporter [Phocaeicola sp.]
MEQTSAKREKRKSLLRIAIPIILSSCLQISYDITDMFWVGKLGSGEVAAVGTAGFYIKLGWSLISVITIGTMVSVSHSIGAEK